MDNSIKEYRGTGHPEIMEPSRPPMQSLAILQHDVVKWANKIAPARQPKDAAVKAVSEMAELLDAVLNKDPNAVREEIGDLMILLVDIANMYGIDPVTAGLDKMAVNKNRAWEIKDGVMRRIR